MTSNTIHDILRRLQTLLDKSGPPGRRNRDAAGIVKEPAWIRPPRQISRIPRIVAIEHIEAAYRAAEQMTIPVVPGIAAPTWWRALIAVAINTGIRRKTFFKLRMDWIHWDRQLILVAGEAMKNGCDHIYHLNQIALHHLQSIRGERELLFPWPLDLRAFHEYFHRLQDRAGIPPQDHFGLQCCRRTLGTALWARSPQASQLALGHAGSAVTMKYYIQAEGIVAQALDALPQPAAFTEASAPRGQASPAEADSDYSI